MKEVKHSSGLSNQSIQKQRGSFMLFTLVIVALLTSVSVIGMQDTIETSRLTQSYKSYRLAEQRAQLALFKAFSRVSAKPTYKVKVNNQPLIPGLYPQIITIENKTISAWRYVNLNNLWENAHYAIVDKDPESSTYLHSYIIEKMLIDEKSSSSNIYRITARGYGLSAKTVVTLQIMVNLDKAKQQLSWAIIH
jgi:Tfp pilus assembly protein PilX